MSDTQAATANAAALTPDICVIGSGPSGLAVATAAAAFGVPVILIERGTMGGSRLDIRKATLLAAAHEAHATRGTGGPDSSAKEAATAYAALHDRVRRAGLALAANDSAERMGALGITVIKGEGRFVSRSTVRVGDVSIKARRFVIATGSRPHLPAIPGLDAVPILTPNTLLNQTRRPDRLIVLGAGSDGVEFAQAMARLGSAVTLVDAGPLLPDEDPEAVGLVRRALLRDGIVLHENAAVQSAEAMRGGVRLVLSQVGAGERTIEGTHLLVAAGTAPDIEALDLDMAGIATSSGGIVVNRSLCSQNRRVFALGGCASTRDGSRLANGTAHQAGIVLRKALFRMSGKLDALKLPRLTGCAPALASIGLSEAQARAGRAPVVVLRWPYSDIQKAQAERETDGFIKVIAHRKGTILGATVVGARAGEVIAPLCLAIQKGLSIKDLAGLALPGLSLAEISTRAASSFYAPLTSKPGIRRMIGILRRFG